jgi:hypothetical protein
VRWHNQTGHHPRASGIRAQRVRRIAWVTGTHSATSEEKPKVQHIDRISYRDQNPETDISRRAWPRTTNRRFFYKAAHLLD